MFNNYYAETLHRMLAVNAVSAFKKVLWPAAMKFLDQKTITKIHVFEPKSLGKLLEYIDSSQFPDFLGGSSTCPAEGGCVRSNSGPWNDPYIMKLIRNAEITVLRQITRVSSDQKKLEAHTQLHAIKTYLEEYKSLPTENISVTTSSFCSRDVLFSFPIFDVTLNTVPYLM